MAEIRLTRVEQGQTKIRNVPIAVTPEGFWCCPSPVVFQKTLKPQNPLNKPKATSPPHKTAPPKKPNPMTERKPPLNPSRLAVVLSENTDSPAVNGSASVVVVPERSTKPKAESVPRKVAIEFGEPGTSDMKLVLLGKQGFCVKLSVHKNVLCEHSGFFADKVSEQGSGLSSLSSCLEVDDCEDVEIYVETVGLMYCKEMKQRFIKQNVSRVLRILKVAELLGFNSCIHACLEYLEAVPWVGEEEEEKVVSSIMRLQGEGIGLVSPVLKRVSSNAPTPQKDTLCQIIELVLKSNDERSRREMKSVVLKLLRENNALPSSADVCIATIYTSCQSRFDLLLSLFKQAAAEPTDSSSESAARQIAVESENLSWLLEILADRHAADEFAVVWAGQRELAALHGGLPIVSRYHVSTITARLFVGIGRGELLPSKDTRQSLLQTWLEPLMSDYKWLQHGCRSFDRKVVEEGIGRTILTLPLEDQQSLLLSWLGSFLRAGDNCPNLQRAFEVWWRRTFVRPYVEQPPQGNE